MKRDEKSVNLILQKKYTQSTYTKKDVPKKYSQGLISIHIRRYTFLEHFITKPKKSITSQITHLSPFIETDEKKF